MEESEEENADSDVEVVFDVAQEENDEQQFEDNVSLEFSSEDSNSSYSENEETLNGSCQSLVSDNYSDESDENISEEFEKRKEEILKSLNEWKKKKRKFDECLSFLYYNGSNCLIDELSDDCLLQIFNYLSLKERIKIERVCKRWRVKSLESWRKFSKLSISNSSDIFNEKMWCSANVKHLEEVLYRCGVYLDHMDVHLNFSRDDALLIIDKMCPNLRSIALRDVENFEPFAYQSLISGFEKLTDIAINNHSSSGNNFVKIFHSKRKFKTIQLDLRSFQIRFLWPFSETLEELFLSVPKISYTDLAKAIGKFKKLKKLFLCFIYVDEILQELLTLNNLKDLRLPQCKISKNKYQEVKNISKLVNLEILDLTSNTKWSVNLTPLVNLKVLRLQYNSYVTDLWILKLTESCKYLTYLNISDCKKVTDIGIQAISELSNLTRLNIENLKNITGKGIDEMKKLQHLDVLGCKNLQINYIFRLLQNAPQLRFLDLTECKNIDEKLFQVASRVVRARKVGDILKIYVSLELFLKYEKKDDDSKLPLIITSESMDFFYEYEKKG